MKRIIIFGASSGIGAELAKSYAAEGNMVAVAARREEMLKELQREYPINIIPFRADLQALPQEEGGSQEESPKGRFLEMLEALGGVDLVIYCSGVGKQNAQKTGYRDGQQIFKTQIYGCCNHSPVGNIG